MSRKVDISQAPESGSLIAITESVTVDRLYMDKLIRDLFQTLTCINNDNCLDEEIRNEKRACVYHN